MLFLRQLCVVCILLVPCQVSGQVEQSGSSTLVIGDSHVQALGNFLESSSLPGARVESRPGWSTSSFISRPDVIPRGYDTVIVILGGNNRNLNYEAYRDRIVRFVLLLRSYGTKKIVWIGPLWSSRSPVNTRHSWTSDAQSVIFDELNIPWINLYRRTVRSRRYRFRDGVHLTYPSYSRLTEEVLNPFISLL